MDDTEKELVEMVLSGRTEAFEPLVAPHRQALLGLAYRLTWNAEDAREVAQEALFRAFRHLRRYDPERSFRNWLFQIAANEARDRGRKKVRERQAIEKLAEEPGKHPDPEAGQDAAEVRSGILKCLDVLGPREREVFVLRDLHDLNIKETARALGCSSLTVRVNLSRAREKIRNALRSRMPYLEESR
jgi:RNA polymerase sigma-70 factor (ECF subfamily)